MTGSVLRVEQGALYPGLLRLANRGFLTAAWGISENNRRAKYTRLTIAGRRHLRSEHAKWIRLAQAMSDAMQATHN
jgi:PadR family transcriptional regulator, regulatory protein PadR